MGARKLDEQLALKGIGRKDAEVLQDVQLEGLGMKKEHCVIMNRPGGLYLKVAEAGADVYLNGVKLKDDEEVRVKNKDMLVFGVCTRRGTSQPSRS